MTELTATLDPAFFELERQASEAYSRFVFDSNREADEFWHVLIDARAAEFLPPFGRPMVDAGRVVAMMACLGQHDLRAMRLRSAAALAKARFFLARPDAQRRVQLASRAQMVVQPSDYYLSRLAVGTGQRRCGFGRRLLTQFEAEATQRGCIRLVLEVSADNAAAIGFYENYGFTRTSAFRVVDDQSGRALEYIHMAKPIA